MSSQRLLYYIGAFIFGGLGVLTLLQIEKPNDQMEAGIFILSSAIIYYGLVTLYFGSSKKVFLSINILLACLALVGIFCIKSLVGTH